MTIEELCERSYKTAVDKGWHQEPHSFGEVTALFHSEVSEALEAVRKDPDHIGEELADVLIRTLELAHMLGIDIGPLTEAKMRQNRVRADVPARAGGKVI